jgi:4a-hydroxytetrahydrobiopterin dehydratase
MQRKRLTKAELNDALASLPGWTIKDGKLYKQFKFRTFAQALGWMVAVGIAADKMDHHPEWSNIYNRVSVNLVTHDLNNSISGWDILLARKMENLFD